MPNYVAPGNQAQTGQWAPQSPAPTNVAGSSEFRRRRLTGARPGTPVGGRPRDGAAPPPVLASTPNYQLGMTGGVGAGGAMPGAGYQIAPGIGYEALLNRRV
jgi:hypothetical protein